MQLQAHACLKARSCTWGVIVPKVQPPQNWGRMVLGCGGTQAVGAHRYALIPVAVGLPQCAAGGTGPLHTGFINLPLLPLASILDFFQGPQSSAGL